MSMNVYCGVFCAVIYILAQQPAFEKLGTECNWDDSYCSLNVMFCL